MMSFVLSLGLASLAAIDAGVAAAPGASETEMTEGWTESRRFGFGSTVLGAGFARPGAGAGERMPEEGGFGAFFLGGQLFLFPSLEARFFFTNGSSIDVSVPVVNPLVWAALTGQFVGAIDTFFNFNFGREWARLLLGPGLGLGVRLPDGWAIRVPLQVGVEFLSGDRHFGFSLQARPFLTLGPSAYVSRLHVGGGAHLLVVLVWYAADSPR